MLARGMREAALCVQRQRRAESNKKKKKNELGSRAALCQRRLKSRVQPGWEGSVRQQEAELCLQTSPAPLEIQLLLSHQAVLANTK